MNLVHLVSNVGLNNLGVWQTALYAKEHLSSLGHQSYFLCCGAKDNEKLDKGGPFVIICSFFEINNFLKSQAIGPAGTLIISHGSWGRPTRFAHKAQKFGYKWVYVPHGMLEPWALRQSSFKKWLYLLLIEKPSVATASGIRAVSEREQENLAYIFKMKHIVCLHNGTKSKAATSLPVKKAKTPVTFLFLARIHKKKGVVELVRGWNASLGKETDVELILAGEDDGGLEDILPHLTANCRYLGPQYGNEKEALLYKAHYFVLPSYSEGFSTGVLEGMSYGAIPLISSACNFQAVFERNLGYRLEPNSQQIASTLNHVMEKGFENDKSRGNRLFINCNFTEQIIGKQLASYYNSIL